MQEKRIGRLFQMLLTVMIITTMLTMIMVYLNLTVKKVKRQ